MPIQRKHGELLFPIPGPSCEKIRIWNRPASGDLMDLNIESWPKPIIPANTDILTCYSVGEGHPSYRNPFEGAYFIQEGLATLKEYAHEYDVETIMKSVRRQIMYGGMYKNRVQCPTG